MPKFFNFSRKSLSKFSSKRRRLYNTTVKKLKGYFFFVDTSVRDSANVDTVAAR